jgi:purine-binding chemotaxis protein CheW
MTSTNINEMKQTSKTAMEAVGAQYLTFLCADEQYGVDILRVQEIKGWSTVTRLPESPPDIMGVLNLRGVIVPVVDLRARFGIESRPADASTVVIVLRVQSAQRERIVGICVDGVSDVHSVAADSVMATPDIGGRADTDYLSGLVTLEGKNVMLLSIDRLLGLPTPFTGEATLNG